MKNGKYDQYKIKDEEEIEKLINKLNGIHDWIIDYFDKKQKYEVKKRN